MTDQEFLDFVTKYKNDIRKVLSEAPMVYGDVKRVKYGTDYHPHDLLINAMSGDVVIEENVFFGHDSHAADWHP